MCIIGVHLENAFIFGALRAGEALAICGAQSQLAGATQDTVATRRPPGKLIRDIPFPVQRRVVDHQEVAHVRRQRLRNQRIQVTSFVIGRDNDRPIPFGPLTLKFMPLYN
jgi:hypothetical protein